MSGANVMVGGGGNTPEERTLGAKLQQFDDLTTNLANIRSRLQRQVANLTQYPIEEPLDKGATPTPATRIDGLIEQLDILSALVKDFDQLTCKLEDTI